MPAICVHSSSHLAASQFGNYPGGGQPQTPANQILSVLLTNGMDGVEKAQVPGHILQRNLTASPDRLFKDRAIRVSFLPTGIRIAQSYI